VFASISSSHVLPFYVHDKLMLREIAYQTCGVEGMKKVLKDFKMAIRPQFPLVYGVFALFDLGHAFKEVGNMLSLQLPKFRGRHYDPFGIISNFTTMVKIKVFINEEDILDDVFLHKNTFREVLHMAQI